MVIAEATLVAITTVYIKFVKRLSRLLRRGFRPQSGLRGPELHVHRFLCPDLPRERPSHGLDFADGDSGKLVRRPQLRLRRHQYRAIFNINCSHRYCQIPHVHACFHFLMQNTLGVEHKNHELDNASGYKIALYLLTC